MRVVIGVIDIQNMTLDKKNKLLKDIFILYLSKISSLYNGDNIFGFIDELKTKRDITLQEIEDKFKTWLISEDLYNKHCITYTDFCYVIKHNWDFVHELLACENGMLDLWCSLIWEETCVELRVKAYKLYKIQWLLHHNLDVDSIIDKVADWNKVGSFREYLENIGFDGSIWVSYDEFLDNEYQDKVYMYELLENFCECTSMAEDYDTVEYGIWLHDDLVKANRKI